MIWFSVHLRQDLEKGLSRRVIEAVSVSNRPVHDCFHSLLDPAGSFGFGDPDGLQHCQDVRRCNIVDRRLTDEREDVSRQGAFPLCRMFRVAPSGPAQLNDAGAGFGEGGD